MDYYDDYYWKSESQLKAERKNKKLIEQLKDKRRTFCGIGTNLIKRMLNRLSENDEVAKALRVALEIEDYNIKAKEAYGKYKQKAYDKKEEYIKELWNLFKKNGWLYGMRNESSFSTSYIVYFDIPGCEQVSWHTNLKCVINMPTYRIAWDGKENSTLNKFELCITSLYTKEIEESAKRNNITLNDRFYKIIQKYKELYGEYSLKLTASLAKVREIEEMELKPDEICSGTFMKHLKYFISCYPCHEYTFGYGDFVVDADNLVSVSYKLIIDGNKRYNTEKMKKSNLEYFMRIEKSMPDIYFSLEKAKGVYDMSGFDPVTIEDRGDSILVRNESNPLLFTSIKKTGITGIYQFVDIVHKELVRLKNKQLSKKTKKDKKKTKKETPSI